MGRNFFLLDAFSCSMDPPAGAAAWLGDKGEEVGESDGMVVRVSVLQRGRAVAPGMICWERRDVVNWLNLLVRERGEATCPVS